MNREDGSDIRPMGRGEAGRSVVGYGRESANPPVGLVRDQRTALVRHGCTRVHLDAPVGLRGQTQPELSTCLASLAPGDTLVVVRLDRLARSLPRLVAVVNDLRSRGVGLRSLDEGLDTASAEGNAIGEVFAALAGFLHDLRVEGTRDGLEAARAGGRRLGRPPALTPEQVAQATAMLTWPGHSIASIARELGVSRSTLYKHVPGISPSGSPASVRSSAGD